MDFQRGNFSINLNFHSMGNLSATLLCTNFADVLIVPIFWCLDMTHFEGVLSPTPFHNRSKAGHRSVSPLSTFICFYLLISTFYQQIRTLIDDLHLPTKTGPDKFVTLHYKILYFFVIIWFLSGTSSMMCLHHTMFRLFWNNSFADQIHPEHQHIEKT